jgi:hypothetical protein
MDKDEEPTVLHPIERVAKDGEPRTGKRCRMMFIALSTLLRLVLPLSRAQDSETTIFFGTIFVDDLRPYVFTGKLEHTV